MRGLELARRFYFEAVQPILERRFPRLEHAAALIGTGSEVLGFDDDMSADHHWGPRVQLFVREADANVEVESVLAHELPTRFAGLPTNFGPPEESGSRLLVAVEAGPVAHRVELLTVDGYMRELIGVNPLERFTPADWLVTPAQRLLEITAGEVFTDPVGELSRVGARLAWYPHDVWLLVMAGLWRRIAQLEHLLGRTGSLGVASRFQPVDRSLQTDGRTKSDRPEVDAASGVSGEDDLGSRLIAASLVHDLMRLALVQERRYPPYWKWLGTAYATLGRAEEPALRAALAAADWRAREDALTEAYEVAARRHNELDVTAAVDPTVRQFYGRPFRVLFADRFVDALREAIEDPDVRVIDHEAGSIDAVSDNTDVLTRPWLWRRLDGLYDRTTSDEGDRNDGR